MVADGQRVPVLLVVVRFHEADDQPAVRFVDALDLAEFLDVLTAGDLADEVDAEGLQLLREAAASTAIASSVFVVVEHPAPSSAPLFNSSSFRFFSAKSSDFKLSPSNRSSFDLRIENATLLSPRMRFEDGRANLMSTCMVPSSFQLLSALQWKHAPLAIASSSSFFRLTASSFSASLASFFPCAAALFLASFFYLGDTPLEVPVGDEES